MCVCMCVCMYVCVYVVFKGAGVDLSLPMLTTCGSGVTAAILSFAAHLLHVTAPLYDVS